MVAFFSKDHGNSDTAVNQVRTGVNSLLSSANKMYSVYPENASVSEAVVCLQSVSSVIGKAVDIENSRTYTP